MLVYEAVGWALVLLGFLLSLQGLWLVCRAMFPARVERCTHRCRQNWLGCLFLGLPIMGLFLFLDVGLARRAGTPGQVAAWLIGSVFLMYAGTGLSGFVTFLGERLGSPADADRAWRATVRGGVVLEMAYLLPVIGWFVLLPASIILGVGAATFSLFGSPRQDLRESLAANRMRAIEPEPRDLPALNSVEAGV